MSAGGRNAVVLAVLVLVVVATVGVFCVTDFGFDFFVEDITAVDSTGFVGVEEATTGEVVAPGSVTTGVVDDAVVSLTAVSGTVVVAVISSTGAFCANAGVLARTVLSEILAIQSST